MPKQKLTINLPADLVEKIKIQAIRERRSLSVIVEELCRGYLKARSKQKA